MGGDYDRRRIHHTDYLTDGEEILFPVYVRKIEVTHQDGVMLIDYGR